MRVAKLETMNNQSNSYSNVSHKIFFINTVAVGKSVSV